MSTDSASTWTQLSIPTLDGLLGGPLNLFFDPRNSEIIYTGATPGGLHKSVDGGRSWIGTGLSDTTCATNRACYEMPHLWVSGLVIHPENTRRLVAGTALGVHRSEDAGETWTPSGLTERAVNVLIADHHNLDRLHAGTEAGLFTTDDGGNSWRRVASVPETWVISMVGEPRSRRFYVGTVNAGVYESTDGGDTYIPINEGLTHDAVGRLVIDSHNPPTVYAGTGDGAFSLTLPRITAIVEEYSEALPEALSLDQNYPNPFNTGTSIRVALPANSDIELAVYDIAGQKVTTLMSGTRQGGIHTVYWDGLDDEGRVVASGIYFYRLRDGESLRISRKLSLIR